MTKNSQIALPEEGSEKHSIRYAGFIAIIGRPNVGKSTLLNQLLNEKLAIMSSHPQTTRQRLLGILTKEPYQVAFFDTPGIHRPYGQGTNLLNRFMMQESLHTMNEVDSLIFVSDVHSYSQNKKNQQTTLNQLVSLHDEDLYLASKLPKGKKVILVINKIDLLQNKQQLLPMLQTWHHIYPFHCIVPISAKNKEGLEDLQREIWSILPKSNALFEEDMLTDRTEKYLSAERIREQVFLATYQEIPYSVAVTIDSWEESTTIVTAEKPTPNRAGVRIDATIHIEKTAQKKILVGHQGKMIRDIGVKARKEIADLLGCPVHLFLFVRVDDRWSNRTSGLQEMGYV